MASICKYANLCIFIKIGTHSAILNEKSRASDPEFLNSFGKMLAIYRILIRLVFAELPLMTRTM